MPDLTCAQCGHSLPADGSFCSRCGAVFVRPPAAVPTPVPAPVPALAPAAAPPPEPAAATTATAPAAAPAPRLPPRDSIAATMVDAAPPALAAPPGKSSQATMFGFSHASLTAKPATSPSPAVTPPTAPATVAAAVTPAVIVATPVVSLAPAAPAKVAAPAAADEGEPRPEPKIKRTMLGFAHPSGAPSGLAAAPPTSPSPPTVPSPGATPPDLADAAPPASQMPGPVPSAKGTMIGVAIPGIAPIQAASEPPPAGGHRKGPSSTMLGVAVPGIAPIHASGNPPPSVSHRPTPVVLPKPAPLVDDEPGIGPAPRLARSGIPVAYVAAGVLALVVVVGVAVALLWKGQSLVVVPRLDTLGREQLHLTCDSCKDGTTASLGASRAEFHDKETDLATEAPLAVGDNALSIRLERPGWGRNEDVKVLVPIAYRIKADLTSLTGAHPTVVVRVQAMPGTVVQVDGKPVTLDEKGEGSYALDVSAQTTGWSDELRLIDQSIPYGISTPATNEHAAADQKGMLPVRAGIATLHLDAPGTSPVIEGTSFRVRGRTVKGGTVMANGQPMPAEADGTFARQMDAPAVGDVAVELRADGPQLASRAATFTVKRVARLADEAKLREKAPWLGHDAIMADQTGSVGKDTVVEGDVVESRGSAGQSVALIDDARGCAAGAVRGHAPDACLVRVVTFGDDVIAPGAHLRVYGKVTSVITAPGGGAGGASGSAVPVVQADFVLKGRGGRR